MHEFIQMVEILGTVLNFDSINNKNVTVIKTGKVYCKCIEVSCTRSLTYLRYLLAIVMFQLNSRDTCFGTCLYKTFSLF